MTLTGRSDLAAIPDYIIPRQESHAILLNSNEFPGGPSPAVLAAMGEAAAQGNRYPAWFSDGLVDRIAAHIDVPADWVTVGCGSVSLCQQLIQATCAAGDDVVCAWRSFEAYPVFARVHGAAVRTVPLTAHHEHDLAAMRAAITDRTRLVFLCNPNNPTGTAVRARELLRFLDDVPPDVLVVVDEAYREFVTDTDVPDCVPEALERVNVAVLRTFSKAHGLAGVRVGYCVAPPALSSVVSKVGVPFSVSRIAQAAASAALEEMRDSVVRCDAVTAERHRVGAALRDAGYEVPDSQANFHWLPLGEASAAFGAHCARRSVLVRVFGDEGVRVTVGREDENDAFLTAALSFTAR